MGAFILVSSAAIAASSNNTLSNTFGLSSKERIQVYWWYLVIIISTIFLKYYYFKTIYRGGISVTIENYIEGSSLLEYIKVVFLLFVRNLADVAIILALLYLFACKLLRIDLKIVIVISTLFILLIGATNQLSLLNVRSLLSYDNFMVSVNWIKDNPDVISSYITKKNIAYLALIIIFSFIPILASKSSMKFVMLPPLNRLLAPVINFSILASFLLYFSIGVFVKANANTIPFQGYWASLILSFANNTNVSPLERKVPPLAVMESEYLNLVYPGKGRTRKQQHNVFLENIEKKHIVIISLETAPQKYYQIFNNSLFTNLYKMSDNAIVTDLHYTGSPTTSTSNYSMLTGMYVPQKGVPILYGKMYFNGLANVLSEQGYTATYIDSNIVDWHAGDKMHRLIDNFGFNGIFDRSSYDYKKETSDIKDPFDKAVYAESRSFKRAMESINESVAMGSKSFVFIDTIMGHFNWKSRKEDANLSSREKILKIINEFDKLLGEFLVFLQTEKIENDVIIVVTGDHGLRYIGEYESLDESPVNIQIGFNVPLMIYSPGLFQEQVLLKHITSHVDLTPTLLELNGIGISQYFYHGENILNPALNERIVFMNNQRLKPESSFYWNGYFYTHNYLTKESFVTGYRDNNQNFNSSNMVSLADSMLNPIEILKNADELFSDSTASFLQRKSVHATSFSNSQMKH